MHPVIWLGLLSLLLSPLSFAEEAPVEKTIKLEELYILGLQPAKSNLNEVREHLWNIGGFRQAKSTIRQRNLDKFFSVSRIRDSYYIEFRYNHAGSVTSVKRLYRPYSVENVNRRTPIQTRDVALELSQQLGPATNTQHKRWGGSLGYRSYIWENDMMRVVVDREGSELLGNVFIEYTIKAQSPYAIATLK